MNIRLCDDAHAILFALAKKRRASQSQVIESLLREAFGGSNYDLAAARRSWNAAQIMRRAERRLDEDEEERPAWAN
jgi:hypothetical protein